MSSALAERPLKRHEEAASSLLPAYARATAASAYVLLFAGALVTSTGSSLSVPDWPLSFGQVMPPMLGGVLFEHGHRLIAGTVSLLTFGLALWLSRAEKRPAVRALGYAAAFGILCQAVLGGVTVLWRLPPPVSIAHACLGQTVFCLLLASAELQSPRYQMAPRVHAGSLWRIGVLAISALFVQLALGALVRHTGQGLIFHAGWAFVAAACALAAAAKGIASPLAELGAPSTILSLAVPAQLALGYGSYRLRFSPDFMPGVHPSAFMTAIHLAVGALILGTCVVWTLRAARCRA